MLYMSFKAFPQIKKLQNKKQREVIRRIIKEASLGSKFAMSVITAIVASAYTAGLAIEYFEIVGDWLAILIISTFFLYALIGHLYIMNVVVKKKIEKNCPDTGEV